MWNQDIMSSMANYRIAQLSDLDLVYQLAESLLRKETPDEMELMMKIWDSRIRKEALTHYLNLGWSFVAENESGITGFFLAQPMLFVNGKTQTLWVEEIMSEDSAIRKSLLDITHKLARDKHLQGVLISNRFESDITHLNIKTQKLNEDLLWIKTTK